MSIKVKKSNKFTPSNTFNSKDKTIWTERQLQSLQYNLQKVFDECGAYCQECRAKFCLTCKDPKKITCAVCDKVNCLNCTHYCGMCKTRECDVIVKDMGNFLYPYAESIFKHSFKKRARCDEMDTVIAESVNALLTDIWSKRKIITTSFGAMLKWKMIYFLDGKINLFDSPTVSSMDAMIDKFPNSNSEDNAEGLIEYYSNTLKEVVVYSDFSQDVLQEDSIDTIISLILGFKDSYQKVLPPKDKYKFYIKSVFAFKRYLEGKTTSIFFKKDYRSQVYYMKLVDTIKKYLSQNI